MNKHKCVFFLVINKHWSMMKALEILNESTSLIEGESDY